MDRRRGLRTSIVAGLVIALALAVVGGAAIAAKKKTVKATAKMTGAKEAPPADPDGTGTADFKLKKKKKQICFDIDFQNIEDPSVAHIHPGKAGVNGPPLITLFEGAGSTSPQSGCVDAAKSDIRKIAKKPKKFYCNVHNTPYPDGAIRGQLKLKGGGGGSSGGDGGGGGGGGLPY
jgi:uncharacterized membrane protein YgcG